MKRQKMVLNLFIRELTNILCMKQESLCCHERPHSQLSAAAKMFEWILGMILNVWMFVLIAWKAARLHSSAGQVNLNYLFLLEFGIQHFLFVWFC